MRAKNFATLRELAKAIENFNHAVESQVAIIENLNRRCDEVFQKIKTAKQ
jgi:hypothetical protein